MSKNAGAEHNFSKSDPLNEGNFYKLLLSSYISV